MRQHVELQTGEAWEFDGGDEAVVILLRVRAAGGDDAVFGLSELGALLGFHRAENDRPRVVIRLDALLLLLQPLRERLLRIGLGLGFDGFALFDELLRFLDGSLRVG